MTDFLAAVFAMKLLNRVLGVLSGLSGFAMFGYAVATSNINTAFSGFGALTMAVALFQIADLRERMKRLEAYIMEHRKTR